MQYARCGNYTHLIDRLRSERGAYWSLVFCCGEHFFICINISSDSSSMYNQHNRSKFQTIIYIFTQYHLFISFRPAYRFIAMISLLCWSHSMVSSSQRLLLRLFNKFRIILSSLILYWNYWTTWQQRLIV